jgi:hypothetical protein
MSLTANSAKFRPTAVERFNTISLPVIPLFACLFIRGQTMIDAKRRMTIREAFICSIMLPDCRFCGFVMLRPITESTPMSDSH